MTTSDILPHISLDSTWVAPPDVRPTDHGRPFQHHPPHSHHFSTSPNPDPASPHPRQPRTLIPASANTDPDPGPIGRSSVAWIAIGRRATSSGCPSQCLPAHPRAAVGDMTLRAGCLVLARLRFMRCGSWAVAQLARQRRTCGRRLNPRPSGKARLRYSNGGRRPRTWPQRRRGAWPGHRRLRVPRRDGTMSDVRAWALQAAPCFYSSAAFLGSTRDRARISPAAHDAALLF